MANHKVCPYCNASLDFGERCDCQDGPSELDIEIAEHFRKKEQERADAAYAAAPDWMKRLIRPAEK